MAVGCAPDAAPVEAEPGAPLPGLTAPERARFGEGRALFQRAFSPEQGLGPFFNQTRCVSCHDLPESGGHGAEPVRKVSRWEGEGRCELVAGGGGSLVQTSVVESLRRAGVRPPGVPPEATEAHELRPPPLYGAGLMEAIDPAAVARYADPDDRNGDGISGRVPTSVDGRPARFGAKGEHATLESFIEGAARGELGLTTPDHPVDHTAGVELPDWTDPAPDPEISAEELELLADYVRFLAPPLPRPDSTADLREGARLFEDTGCAACHVPEWVTGEHPSAALSRQRFRLYSDLLLHDMGPDLAGVCGPDAAPREWMTMRLVGLGLRHEFLHDRRANRIEDAIRWHGGEAQRSRDAFLSLPEELRSRLLAFLRTL